jgi:segregation and condensation protein B
MAAAKVQPVPPVVGLPALVRESDSAGLALDELTQALAGMIDRGADPYVALADDSTENAPSALGEQAAEGVCEVTPRSILEALLFVGSPTNEPLSSRYIASLMRGVRAAEIDGLVQSLNAEYELRNCPYRIHEEAGGYRLTLCEEYDRLREKFFGRARQARLSPAAIEVLAAVAYNEPVTAEEVAKLRGAVSGHILAQLVRRQLVRLERTETKPRKSVYWTTDRFLSLFGLESLADLPRGEDSAPG